MFFRMFFLKIYLAGYQNANVNGTLTDQFSYTGPAYVHNGKHYTSNLLLICYFYTEIVSFFFLDKIFEITFSFLLHIYFEGESYNASNVATLPVGGTIAINPQTGFFWF